MRPETLTWIGGEDEFCLPLPLQEALEQRCDDKLGQIFLSVASGFPSTTEIVATISLALEGGGMNKKDAVKRVRQLCEDHGTQNLVLTANAILSWAWQGWPSDEEESSGEVGAEAP